MPAVDLHHNRRLPIGVAKPLIVLLLALLSACASTMELSKPTDQRVQAVCLLVGEFGANYISERKQGLSADEAYTQAHRKTISKYQLDPESKTLRKLTRSYTPFAEANPNHDYGTLVVYGYNHCLMIQTHGRYLAIDSAAQRQAIDRMISGCRQRSASNRELDHCLWQRMSRLSQPIS